MSDESELIEQLLQGSESAYRSVVEQYHSLMLQVARSIVGASIADEVVQESWVSVIKALPDFEKRASLKTWILRIVSNTAKTRLRKENRSIAVGDINDLELFSIPDERFEPDGHWAAPPRAWDLATPDAILASDELKARLRDGMNKLPSMQQTILVLREMEGLEMDEICKILGISESNSRVLLHRARVQLWQVVDRYENDAKC